MLPVGAGCSQRVGSGPDARWAGGGLRQRGPPRCLEGKGILAGCGDWGPEDGLRIWVSWSGRLQ